MSNVFHGDGNHCRNIDVDLSKDRCLKCGEEKIVLGFDSSDGEYSVMFFCLQCINGFFSKNHIVHSDKKVIDTPTTNTSESSI